MRELDEQDTRPVLKRFHLVSCSSKAPKGGLGEEDMQNVDSALWKSLYRATFV